MQVNVQVNKRECIGAKLIWESKVIINPLGLITEDVCVCKLSASYERQCKQS